MRVRIDEAWADNLASGVDYLVGGVYGIDLVAGSDRFKLSIFDRYRTVRNNANIAHFGTAFGFAARSTRHQLAYICDQKVCVHRK
jgi:hypothetical protein